MTVRVGVYCPDLPPIRGGVPDHTLALARALEARGTDVVVLGRRGDAAIFSPVPCVLGVTHRPGRHGLATACREAGVRGLLIQYVPFLFARLGLAPALVWSVGTLARAGVRIALLVHEPWVPPTRPVWRLTHGPMRRQLLALVRRADAIYSPTPAFLEMVRPAARAGAVLAVVPVGATVPVAATDRASARRALGLRPEEVVIGIFSPGASGALIGWVERAMAALAGLGAVRWIAFGNGSETLPAAPPPPAALRRLGWVVDTAASQAFRALDLAVAPFEDGLTLRRTSAMAALAHGVPLVSSGGAHADPALAEAAECPADADAFADAVRGLVLDGSRRRDLGRRGREFYERHGSADVLAARLAVELGGPR